MVRHANGRVSSTFSSGGLGKLQPVLTLVAVQEFRRTPAVTPVMTATPPKASELGQCQLELRAIHFKANAAADL